MITCDKYARLNLILEVVIEELADGKDTKTFAENLINDIYMLYINGEIGKPCLSCSECLDSNFYITELSKYLSNKIDTKTLKESLQYHRKAQAIDNIINHFPKANSRSDFGIYSEFHTNQDGLIIYLDHNMLNKYCRDYNIREMIKISKMQNRCIYMYSPSHLEEVCKMRNPQNEELTINAITELTENLLVLNIDNQLKLVYEKPIYSYNRVQKNIDGSRAVEEYRLTANADKDIFFTEFTDESHKKSINNGDLLEEHSDLLNKVLLRVGLPYTLHDIKAKTNVLNEYYDLNNIVYKFYKALDMINYYSDKEKKRIRSGSHDIEHIIYGAKSNIFVSTDKRLRKRAEIIYKAMNLNILVLGKDDFIEFLQTL